MWLQELAEYVRSAKVDGIGDNVWAYTMRSNDVGAMLTEQTTGILADVDIPGLYKGAVQLIVRSSRPQDSLYQAKAVSDLLDSNQRRFTGDDMAIELPSYEVRYMFPRHLPIVYPRSDGNFFESSVNFDVCMVAVSG